jgi:hypothetical protein
VLLHSTDYPQRSLLFHATLSGLQPLRGRQAADGGRDAPHCRGDLAGGLVGDTPRGDVLRLQDAQHRRRLPAGGAGWEAQGRATGAAEVSSSRICGMLHAAGGDGDADMPEAGRDSGIRAPGQPQPPLGIGRPN